MPRSPGTGDSHALAIPTPALREGRKVSSASKDGFVIVDGIPMSAAEVSRGPQPAQQTGQETEAKVNVVVGTDDGNEEISNADIDHLKHLKAQIQRLDLDQFAVAAGKITSTHNTFAAMRDQVLGFRNQVLYQRREHRHKRNFVKATMKDAEEFFSKHSGEMAATEIYSQMKEWNDRLEQDLVALTKQEDELDDMENILSTIEYQLLLQEREQTKHYLDAFAALDKLDLGLSEEAKVAMGLPSSEKGHEPEAIETSAWDPLLEIYYDKYGDVKVAQGRLLDFELDYDDTRTKINFEQDQGISTDTTMEQFEKNSERERSHLRQLLNHAIEAADSARHACEQQGLDPDAYKKDLEEQPQEFQQPEYANEHEPENQNYEVDNLDYSKTPMIAYPRDAMEPPVAHLRDRDHPAETSGDRSRIASWIQTVESGPTFGEYRIPSVDEHDLDASSTSTRQQIRRTRSYSSLREGHVSSTTARSAVPSTEQRPSLTSTTFISSPRRRSLESQLGILLRPRGSDRETSVDVLRPLRSPNDE